MKAVIPTGGRGTRMQPLTFSTNKHFIPLANKPLIYYPIETIAGAGIKDICITYNPGWLDKLKSLLGNGGRWGVKFTYVLQSEPKGLANIFQVCEEVLDGEPFVMHLGDNIFTAGIEDLVAHFLKEKPNGLVAMVEHPENSRLGVPYFDKGGRLVKYVEKPKNPPHKFAIPGIYFFDKNVFKCFRGKGKIKPSSRGEYEISSPFQWLIDNNYRVDVVEYGGKWLDPGKFDDWIYSNRYLLKRNMQRDIRGKVDTKSKIVGPVEISCGCRVINSKIEGPTSIAENVLIKNAHIGPFTSIAAGSVIDNSDLENSVIMPGVKITGVNRRIDKSLIGSSAEIHGNGKKRNNAKMFIGEKSIVEL